jgi:opacity protein-like surface antigen
MKRRSAMRKSLALFAIALAAGHASAADLRFPPPGPGYLPPAYLPPALPRWTGCYVGGNVGGAWANIDESSGVGGTVSANPAGVAGGGQIGCDIQFDQWVFGIRDMLDATNLRASTNFPAGSANGRINWFDTLTAREGYLVQPNALWAGRRGLDQYQRDRFQHRGHANRQLLEQQSGLDARRRRRMDVRTALVGVRRI